jgi:hypothetical protein
MTDQRKDEMPDEIWVKEFVSDDNQTVLEAMYIEGGNYKPYVRKDLSPPVPDDVSAALRMLDTLCEWAHEENSLACEYGDFIGGVIRAASTPPAEVRALMEAIDGMRICHGMTQAPMTDHAYWNDEFERKRVEALAALDAVLEEGGR